MQKIFKEGCGQPLHPQKYNMKTIFNLPTVTIGIPALNEGKNIGTLLQSLISQEERGFVIEQIVVISDGSTDNTAQIVNATHDPRIDLIDGHERLGKAVRQNEMLERCASEIIVFLDADIKIVSLKFIHNLVEPILEGRADFTSGRIAPLKPKGLVDSVLAHAMRVKTYLYESHNNGDSVYSCFGPARAFSRSAYQKLHFQKVAGEDAYSYLQMKQANMRFASASDAVFYVRCPGSIADHKKQSVRFLSSQAELSTIFGEEYVRKAYNMPLFICVKGILYSFTMSPFHSIIYVVIYLYMKLQAIRSRESQFLWEAPKTSKDLV